MKTPWKHLLVRNRMFCSICFHETQARQAHEGPLSAEEGSAASWVRIAEVSQSLNPVNPRTAGTYTAKLKADFRRHISQTHPNWLDRIDWSRAL